MAICNFDHPDNMRNLHFACETISLTWFGPALLLCLGLVMCNSCKRPESISQEGLYGHWDITKAERNGKETDYLRNGFFIINPDGIMTLNITGEEEKGKYTMDHNKLILEDNRIFDIQSLRNDSMTISYAANSGSQFIFYMTKKKDDDR